MIPYFFKPARKLIFSDFSPHPLSMNEDLRHRAGCHSFRFGCSWVIIGLLITTQQRPKLFPGVIGRFCRFGNSSKRTFSKRQHMSFWQGIPQRDNRIQIALGELI
jgi:hypothetical protein